MTREPPFTELMQGLPDTTPFVGPEALERRNGVKIHLRLGANESRFGISPAAYRALEEVIGHVPDYGDPENHELREELALRHGARSDNIVVASGIDDLLGLAARVFVADGAPTVTSRGTYPTSNYHVVGYGGRLHEVPYAGDAVDLNALAEAARRHSARLVYLANPDNPAGTFHGREDVQRLVDSLPDGCVVLLDEAYSDFAPSDDLLPVDVEDWRVLRMRTFSKAHGFAGLRIGYAIVHEAIATAFGKVRHHFGVNRCAQTAALASLRDPGFAAGVARAVEAGRAEYERLAGELGLRALPSSTNFVAVDVGSATTVRRLLDTLLTRGVFVRSGTQPPLDRCIRITVGTPPERSEFAAALRDVLPDVLGS